MTRLVISPSVGSVLGMFLGGRWRSSALSAVTVGVPVCLSDVILHRCLLSLLLLLTLLMDRHIFILTSILIILTRPPSVRLGFMQLRVINFLSPHLLSILFILSFLLLWC